MSKRISDKTALAVYELRSEGKSYSAIAREVGISHTCVANILTGRSDEWQSRIQWERTCRPFRNAAADLGRKYIYDEAARKFTMVQEPKKKKGRTA